MTFSQPDRNQVDADLVWLNTFNLLYAKEDINFVAGLWSWSGCCSHWLGPSLSWAVSLKARNSNEMVTRPESGRSRLGMDKDTQLNAFKS
jgi:hypothetical protein